MTIAELVARGLYLDAIPHLQTRLAGQPDDAEAHFQLALSLHLTGADPSRALDHFNLAELHGFDPSKVRLNRGILRAETGDDAGAYRDFHNAGPAAAAYRDQAARTLLGAASAADLYYPPPHLPHLDATWLETCSMAQSRQFLIDCLPAIRRLAAGAQTRGGQVLEVLDVGTASAAGAGLLADLHSGQFFGAGMRVTAIDLVRRYRRYAEKAFPRVEYICGDLYQYEPARSWDLVLCSHTIEHFTDPTPLIEHCRRRARQWALFYAPYNEQDLISGHLRSIGREFIDAFEPLFVEVLESPGWRHPVDAESRTVLFALQGTAVS